MWHHFLLWRRGEREGEERGRGDGQNTNYFSPHRTQIVPPFSGGITEGEIIKSSRERERKQMEKARERLKAKRGRDDRDKSDLVCTHGREAEEDKMKVLLEIPSSLLPSAADGHFYS